MPLLVKAYINRKCLRDLKKEESLFQNCLVPLKITTYVGENLTVIWRNPKYYIVELKDLNLKKNQLI